MRKNSLELWVGLLGLIGVTALLGLAFKVSDLSLISTRRSYSLNAVFDNLGSLKVRAPVTVAGVRVGEVAAVKLDPVTYKATVTLAIERDYQFPEDSSAKILTAGVLGANYVEIVPGYADEKLANGAEITETQPAVVLEHLIGQVIYSLGQGKGDAKNDG